MYNTLTNENYENYEINAMQGYINLDSKSCIATVNATLAGTLTVMSCPSGNVPGTQVTVTVRATNTGNVNNNSFVIGITVARSNAPNNPIAQNDSGNLDITVGNYAEYSLSFTMPGVDVNVAYSLKADPAFSY